MNVLTKSSLFQLAVILCTLLLIQGCEDNSTNFREPNFNPPPQFNLSEADTSYTTEEGLKVYIIEEGYGPFEVIPRDQIRVNYTIYSLDGKVYDSTYENEITAGGILRNLGPVPINSGNQSVPPLIEGFRQGLLGMVEGEKRTIIVPPSLGYENYEFRQGENGYDLRGDTLRYDIELESIF